MSAERSLPPRPGQTISITFVPADEDAKPTVATIELRQQDIDAGRQITLTQYLDLRPDGQRLHTHNPLVALKWGVIETRDLIMQFYVTLQRMLTRDVGLSNVMGPVGLAHRRRSGRQPRHRLADLVPLHRSARTWRS